MVRKRWRGVAPYFYTVWPLLCIIPHLARSSRDAGSRYADLSSSLKTRTYRAFRRSDEWWTTPRDPPRDPLLRLLFSADDAFQSERWTNRATIFLQYDKTNVATYAGQFKCWILEFLKRFSKINLLSLNIQIYELANFIKISMCRTLNEKIYIKERVTEMEIDIERN